MSVPQNPRRSLLAFAVCTTLVAGLGACDRAPAPSGDAARPAEQSSAPAKASLGTFGFDTAGMDKSVAPGDDFFAYANGGWAKTTEIPADRSNLTSFSVVAQQAQKDTRAIVEAAANDAKANGDEKRIGDYYAAFMDEAGIEAKGLAPVKPELAAISAISDATSLAKTLGGQLRADVDLLNNTHYYTDRLFGLWVSQDINEPSRVAPYLVQGGLGMPDRSFYLEGGRMAELRKAYQAHVAKLLSLAGIADADAKAARILALEIAIAKVHATQEETNDVAKGANAWKRADFDARAPGLDWPAYFDAAGLGQQQDFVVWQPKAVAGISALVKSQPLDTWKDYLAYHALDRASPYLPKAFVDENFDFHGHVLNGTPRQAERWKRAIDDTTGALGEAIGKLYADKHFSPRTKARAEQMVQNILAAFGKRIDALDWMTPETKAQARAKLAGLKVGVGYPETWRDYSALEVKRDDALGNAERAGEFEYRRNLAKLGKPVGHNEWCMLPQTVNAVNLPLENRLLFPAAILQPPFFDPNADDAVNYGGIGAVIGHEISHSFDNMGALFDATGKLRNWWTKEDFAKFEATGAALAAQFDAYKPFTDLHVNGKLTLGEDIADVAGLATAYDAYHASWNGKAPATLDGYTPDQRFFLGFAQVWRSKFRDEALRNRVLTDVHAPGMYRALTVRNLDAWYPAFDVKDGQKLYLAPDKRVKIW
jgi:putative endopeptidase